MLEVFCYFSSHIGYVRERFIFLKNVITLKTVYKIYNDKKQLAKKNNTHINITRLYIYIYSFKWQWRCNLDFQFSKINFKTWKISPPVCLTWAHRYSSNTMYLRPGGSHFCSGTRNKKNKNFYKLLKRVFNYLLLN